MMLKQSLSHLQRTCWPLYESYIISTLLNSKGNFITLGKSPGGARLRSAHRYKARAARTD